MEENEKKQRERGKDFYEWVQALVCSVLAVVVLFTFVGVNTLLPGLHSYG